eukprot:TRINITY_DN10054_c0_g1_i1.p1 TRINITY_DN10054_c0_g1~~TRINITY_DN10054_c0_g1_i1.p1  ORF type:complete len:301 (-),score=53.92 TRINITY_DN10054_c0_g1_i1:333-1235(-)
MPQHGRLRITDPNGKPGPSIYYELHGYGDIKVVFISGFTMTSEYWAPQLEFFTRQQGFQVLTHDNRGCGRSDSPKHQYTTTMMANDTMQIINHVGWKRFHIVGFSMGGMISQELAVISPKRVLSLTLICTHGGRRLVPTSTVYSIAVSLNTDPLSRILRELGFQYSAEYLRSEIDGTRWTKRKALVEEYLNRFASHGFPPFLGIYGQLFAIIRHNLDPKRTFKLLQEKEFPILVMIATGDQLVAPGGQFQLKNKLKAQHIIYEGSGHHVTVERQDEVNQDLLVFIRQAHKEALLRPNPSL